MPPGFNKILRDNQGDEQQDLAVAPIPWRPGTQRVIDIVELASAIQQKTSTTPFTSAQFALQMIEGAEEVVFQIDTTHHDLL